MDAAARDQYKRVGKGMQVADRFGRMKFREFDEQGVIKPN